MPTETDFLLFLESVLGRVEGPKGPYSFESRLIDKRFICRDCAVILTELEHLPHLRLHGFYR